MLRLILAAVAAACSLTVLADVCLAAPRPTAMRKVTLDIPGPPARVLPVDVNGDGRIDLVMALAWSEFESVEFERLEGFVQMTTIVPALFDRREIRVYLQQPDGQYLLAGPALMLPASVLALDSGPGPTPVVALTDEGVAALKLEGEAPYAALTFSPLIADPPVLAGAGTLMSSLRLRFDLDGDAHPDLMFPAEDGMALYRGGTDGPSPRSVTRLPLPDDRRGRDTAPWRRYSMPRLEDLDSDRLPDLFVVTGSDSNPIVHVFRGEGEGRFASARVLTPLCDMGQTGATGEHGGWGELAHFGDITGDGLAEVVTSTEKSGDDDGLDEAREPHFTYRFYHARKDLTVDPKPYLEMEVLGHPFGAGVFSMMGGSPFVDLDHDGRKEILTITLDFSLWQAIRVLTTKRFGMGLDFQLWSQGAGGSFTKITGLDLSEKLLLDFNDLKMPRFGHFSGDFNGDGIKDFVHLGRGKEVTIHYGKPGSHYPPKPDVTLDIGTEIQDVALARIADLDGDGRSDLSITRMIPSDEAGVTGRARLELYLSSKAAP